MTPRTLASIEDVDADAWNALVASDQPFAAHGFLAALEASASVAPERGWQPAHLILEDDDGHIAAAAPVYEKTHSFGEFVFDFAWANAYRRCGLAYYPKLVCAVPFTPVAGPRLLARDASARRELARQLAALAAARERSSAHVLFPDDASMAALRERGALVRRGCQYRWYNRGYADFEDFLARLSSKRRKQIRRERRGMRAAEVRVDVLAPGEISAELWATLYAFYDRTYAVRGQQPYLTPAFFAELSARLPGAVRFFVAYHRRQPVGMAFMMYAGDTLYGRHWGCADDYQDLHFETCYYAAIDYCIARGIACFDAGVQGEHKIRRGFEPVATWSAHFIEQPQLRAAIGDFCAREAEAVAELEAEQRARASFAEPL